MTGVTSDGRIRHAPRKVGALRGQRVSPGPLQFACAEGEGADRK